MIYHVLSHPQFFPKSLAPSRFSDHIHQIAEDFLEEVVLAGLWRMDEIRGGEEVAESHIKKRYHP